MLGQFAFSGDPDNPYLPAQHVENAVIYTGTHDNDTTLGWFGSIDEETQQYVREILDSDDEPMPWLLIRAAFESPCRLAVAPMQDYLELDGTNRMNTPGTVEGNWVWRFKWDQVPKDLAAHIRELVEHSNRVA